MYTPVRIASASTSPNKKPRRLRVLLDCDGVLADFVGAALGLIKKVTGKPYTKANVKQWDFINDLVRDERDYLEIYQGVHAAGFCAGIHPLAGAEKGMAELRKMPVDIYVVTAPQFESAHWVPERTRWLNYHFRLDKDRLLYTDAKRLAAGDVFVDDSSEHVASWRAEHPAGVGYVMDAPHNTESDQPRVRNWRSLVSKIKALLKGGAK